MRKKRLFTLLVAVAVLLGCFTLPVMAEDDTTPPIGELVSSISLISDNEYVAYGEAVTVEVRLADGVTGVTGGNANWSHTSDCQPIVWDTALAPVEGDESLLRGSYEVAPETVTIMGASGHLTISQLTLELEDQGTLEYDWEAVRIVNFNPGFNIVVVRNETPNNIVTTFPNGTEVTSYQTNETQHDIMIRTNCPYGTEGTAYFHNEAGEVAFTVFLWSDRQVTGDFYGNFYLNASYERDLVANGTYTLARLELNYGDQAYAYALNPALGEEQLTDEMGGTITVNRPADTTPPEIVPGSLWFAVNETDETLEYGMDAIDDISGVGYVMVEFARQGTIYSSGGYGFYMNGKLEENLSGFVAFEYIQVGNYYVHTVTVDDNAGNTRMYSGEAEIMALLGNPDDYTFSIGEWFEGYEEPQDITIDYPFGNVFTEYSSNITNVTVYTNWKYATQIGLTYMDNAGNTFTARLPVGSLSEPGKLAGWLDYTYANAAGEVAPNGEYHIVAMRLLGLKDGKDVYYDYNLNPGAGELPLPAALAAASVTLNLPEDNTAPEVDAGSFKSNRAGQTVRPLTQMTFTLTAQDDISGVGQAVATFKGPGNASIDVYLGAGYNPNQLTGSFMIENARHANGTYTLDSLLVRDRAGNQRVYTGAALKSLLASPQDAVFTVEGTDIDYVVTPDSNLSDELEKLLEQFEGSEETPVLLIETAQAEKNVLPSDFFKAAAGKDVEIRIALEAEGLYGTYLVFEGQSIDAGKAIDMELGLTLGDTKAYSFIPADNTTSQVLVFPDNGVLPGAATLLVPAYGSTKAMNLYFHDLAAGKLVLEAEGIKAQDGYYHVPITHNSTFVLTDVLLDSPAPNPGPEENSQKANPSSGVKLRAE